MFKLTQIMSVAAFAVIAAGSVQAEDTSVPRIDNEPLLFARSYDRSHINNTLRKNYGKKLERVAFWKARREAFIDRVLSDSGITDTEKLKAMRLHMNNEVNLYSRTYDKSYVDTRLDLNQRKMGSVFELRRARLNRHMVEKEGGAEVTRK